MTKSKGLVAPIPRGKGGVFISGVGSPNPGGQTSEQKIISMKLKDLKVLAAEHREDAVMALVANLKDENGAVRNAAAIALLNRSDGMPKQSVDVTARALVATITRMIVEPEPEDG